MPAYAAHPMVSAVGRTQTGDPRSPGGAVGAGTGDRVAAVDDRGVLVSSEDPSRDRPSGPREVRESPGLEEAQALLDALRDAAAFITPERIILVSTAMDELLGYARPDSLVQVRPREFFERHFPKGQKFGNFELLELGLHCAREGASEHTTITGLAGVSFPAEVRYAPVTLGGTSALLVSIRSLSQLEELRAQLKRAERLASIGALSSGVAQAINNPLAYIATNVAYCMERIRYLEELLGGSASMQVDDPRTLRGLLLPISEALAEAHQGASRVEQLARALWTLVEGDEEGALVDLSQLLEAAIQMSLGEHRHRARLRTEFSGGGSVRASTTRLTQVFVNLIANSAQAFEEDLPTRNRITIRVHKRTPQLLIDIEDNGPGMSRDVLTRAFEPFFTTRALGQGSGLGLTIAKNLVEAMGGTLELHSEAGRGCLARVVLPEAHAQASERPRQNPTATGMRKKILVVDNEPLIVRAVSRLLQNDHDLETAENGREALELILHDGPFDLIICDLVMPEMSGMDLFRELERVAPEAIGKFVFLTGGAFTEQSAAFLRSTPCPTLEKPLQPDVLRAFVRGHSTAGEPPPT